MWKIDANGDAYNADDPRDFMFVRKRISICRHTPGGSLLNSIIECDAGFVSVDAAKKHLAQMVKELNEKEACK